MCIHGQTSNFNTGSIFVKIQFHQILNAQNDNKILKVTLKETNRQFSLVLSGCTNQWCCGQIWGFMAVRSRGKRIQIVTEQGQWKYMYLISKVPFKWQCIWLKWQLLNKFTYNVYVISCVPSSFVLRPWAAIEACIVNAICYEFRNHCNSSSWSLQVLTQCNVHCQIGKSRFAWWSPIHGKISL